MFMKRSMLSMTVCFSIVLSKCKPRTYNENSSTTEKIFPNQPEGRRLTPDEIIGLKTQLEDAGKFHRSLWNSNESTDKKAADQIQKTLALTHADTRLRIETQLLTSAVAAPSASEASRDKEQREDKIVLGLFASFFAGAFYYLGT